jgi:S1-C subfamily serine protease
MAKGFAGVYCDKKADRAAGLKVNRVRDPVFPKELLDGSLWSPSMQLLFTPLGMSALALVVLFAEVPATAQTNDRMSTSDVVRAARYSIAEISVTNRTKNPDGSLSVSGSTGSGFVVDEDGDIVTNCHVVAGAQVSSGSPVNVEVVFPDEPTAHLPAKVLGCDELGDIAVVHVNELDPDRKPLKWADMRRVEVGEDVVTIGFAKGIYGAPTVARGVVSALKRSFLDGTVSDLVQTDAAINHGNSGGPLLNMRGEVVGVNTYTSVSTIKLGDILAAMNGKGKSGSEVLIPVTTSGLGMYYARSAASASLYTRQIIATGQVPRADLGIRVSMIDLNHNILPRPSVLVTEVVPGSQAASIGLHPGDLLYGLEWANGFVHEIPDVGSLNEILALIKPGDRVKLNVYRLSAEGVAAAEALKPIPDAAALWRNADWTVNQTGEGDTVSRLRATIEQRYPSHPMPFDKSR